MSYLVRRLEFFVITLWAALTINFILPRIMPGNPAQAMIVRFHGRVSPEAVKAIEVAFGLHSHESIFQQYRSTCATPSRETLARQSPFSRYRSATSSTRGGRGHLAWSGCQQSSRSSSP